MATKPSYLLGFNAFHNVAIDAHRDGSLTVGPAQIVINRIDVGANENNERIEQSVFSLTTGLAEGGVIGRASKIDPAEEFKPIVGFLLWDVCGLSHIGENSADDPQPPWATSRLLSPGFPRGRALSRKMGRTKGGVVDRAFSCSGPLGKANVRTLPDSGIE
jgi:hypothetical protein